MFRIDETTKRITEEAGPISVYPRLKAWGFSLYQLSSRELSFSLHVRTECADDIQGLSSGREFAN